MAAGTGAKGPFGGTPGGASPEGDPDPLAANLHWWDSTVPVHVASDFYDVEGWLADQRGPRAHEAAVLGDVTGLDLVHLQCHFGKDTLSWARAGAQVTGLDFSPIAIEAARHLAERAGLSSVSTFVCAPLSDAVDVLGAGSFDVVYVSLGALCWLPSIDEWAGQVAGLLRPGGRLFLHEVHPLSAALSDDDLTLVYPYFEEAAGVFDAEAGSYADQSAIDALPGDPTYTWNHGMGEIIGAVVSHGLRIDRLDEHDWTSFARYPWLVQHGEEEFVTPADRLRIPLSFTLAATKA